MKKQWKGFVFGMVFAFLLSGSIAWAKQGKINADLYYRNITIKKDASTLKTANEPFILNGYTYLPLRDVATILDIPIAWDDATSTITLGKSDTTTSSPDNSQTSASAFEKEVFDLTNAFRAENGLKPFTWSQELSNVAKAHSDDMSARNFFSHNNPDGKSPFDRMKDYGISFTAAAENIAYGQKTPAQVVEAWKNSAGHRANMLGNYQMLGVGYCADGNYWTQNFATMR